MTDTSYMLLTVLQSYAPNGQAQEMCTQMLNHAKMEGDSKKQIDIMLCNTIIDGLKYENWPWTKTYSRLVYDASATGDFCK